MTSRDRGHVIVAAVSLALALLASVTTSRSRAASGSIEHVEISAPVLPRVSLLYEHEGSNFPTSPADIAQLAHDAALTFDFLLSTCPAKYPQIVVADPHGPAPTPEQDATNFEQLAQCAYNEYVSKPYWIPAIVDQVDVCGTELGSSWHLIGEDEVESLSDAEAMALAHALTTPNADSFFGNLYFSLKVWVRGRDGSLKQGDLSPGVSPRVSPLAVSASSTMHYEAGLSLRCIRRTIVM